VKPGKSALDVLRATLPAGTLSGAPKVRAMEIIDELEPVKRGIYGGAVGYLGWNGRHGHRHRDPHRRDQGRAGSIVQAGAGVVADSVPRARVGRDASTRRGPSSVPWSWRARVCRICSPLPGRRRVSLPVAMGYSPERPEQ
jgi:hypothetical protein